MTGYTSEEVDMMLLGLYDRRDKSYGMDQDLYSALIEKILNEDEK